MSSLLGLVAMLGFTSFTQPFFSYENFLTPEEWCAARVVFHEGGSAKFPEPYGALQKIAYVVYARKLENRRKWGGDTACGVAYKNAKGTWQFTSMKDPRNRYSHPSGWRWDAVVKATLSVFRGGWRPEGEDAAMRYYMRREKSDAKCVKAFDAEFLSRGLDGHHEFFAPIETLYDELRRFVVHTPEDRKHIGLCQRGEAAQLYSMVRGPLIAHKQGHHRRKRR